MIESTGSVFTLGKTVDNMRVIGTTASSMEKESTDNRTAWTAEGDGKRENA